MNLTRSLNPKELLFDSQLQALLLVWHLEVKFIPKTINITSDPYDI